MESIDILHPINTELLSPKYYFQSLVEQAYYCGLLSDKRLSSIQNDLLLILAEQANKWRDRDRDAEEISGDSPSGQYVVQRIGIMGATPYGTDHDAFLQTRWGELGQTSGAARVAACPPDKQGDAWLVQTFILYNR